MLTLRNTSIKIQMLPNVLMKTDVLITEGKHRGPHKHRKTDIHEKVLRDGLVWRNPSHEFLLGLERSELKQRKPPNALPLLSALKTQTLGAVMLNSVVKETFRDSRLDLCVSVLQIDKKTTQACTGVFLCDSITSCSHKNLFCCC